MVSLTFPAFVKIRILPAFSVTKKRPSGRVVIPQGLVKAVVTTVVLYLVEVVTPLTRVWPVKGGL